MRQHASGRKTKTGNPYNSTYFRSRRLVEATVSADSPRGRPGPKRYIADRWNCEKANELPGSVLIEIEALAEQRRSTPAPVGRMLVEHPYTGRAKEQERLAR